jgi:hypothetical protein
MMLLQINHLLTRLRLPRLPVNLTAQKLLKTKMGHGNVYPKKLGGSMEYLLFATKK